MVWYWGRFVLRPLFFLSYQPQMIDRLTLKSWKWSQYALPKNSNKHLPKYTESHLRREWLFRMKTWWHVLPVRLQSLIFSDAGRGTNNITWIRRIYEQMYTASKLVRSIESVTLLLPKSNPVMFTQATCWVCPVPSPPLPHWSPAQPPPFRWQERNVQQGWRISATCNNFFICNEVIAR
jgi:hypothetical protein